MRVWLKIRPAAIVFSTLSSIRSRLYLPLEEIESQNRKVLIHGQIKKGAPRIERLPYKKQMLILLGN